MQRSGNTFELHGTDILERDPFLMRGVGDRLGHQSGPGSQSDCPPCPQVLEDAMDWCQLECELTEGLAWKQ